VSAPVERWIDLGPSGDQGWMVNRFRSFTLSDGRRYVNAKTSDPSLSGMHCNLRGECGVAMPPEPGSSLDAAEQAVVDAWLACGSPLN
jgi:hypothetical protein